MTQNYDFSASLAAERQQDLLRTAAVGRFARLVRRNRRNKPVSGGAGPSRDPSSVPIAQSSPSPGAVPTTSPCFEAQTA